MVSIASELLPEPLRPQQTVILSRGISTSTPLRLCCQAPRTRMVWSPKSSPPDARPLRRAVLAAFKLTAELDLPFKSGNRAAAVSDRVVADVAKASGVPT